MTPAIGSVLELPFRERPLVELLGFDPAGERTDLELESTGFGWCRPGRIWLQGMEAEETPGAGVNAGAEAGAGAGTGGHRVGAPLLVEEPLVLALHSADDGPALPDDIVLEFWLDEHPPVAAPLSLFLERWLPRLPRGPGDGPIVLALCNPHRAQVVAPVAAGGRPLYYALGDADAWLDPAEDPAELLADEEQAGGRIRLVAAAWQRAKARPPASP